MTENLSRRQMMTCTSVYLGAGVAAAVTGAATAPAVAAAAQDALQEPFRYCLNTGTLLGKKLPIVEEVQIAAQAGYQGIEPWVREIQQYVDQGGSLADLKKRIADRGLTVEGAIGFPSWCVDDEAKRIKGMEQFKREMDLVAQIGGLRIAAPPAGANKTPGMDLRKIAERYRDVLELGKQQGLVAHLEIWGGSQTLSRISEAAYVAIESGHTDASLLLDCFHIYKSGCGFTGIRMLNGAALHVFHINDYPADPPREKATDADRVFPGDGVAPLASILRDLRSIGFRGALSLELFNREYWKQDDGLTIAKTGLEKLRAAVRKAFA